MAGWGRTLDPKKVDWGHGDRVHTVHGPCCQRRPHPLGIEGVGVEAKHALQVRLQRLVRAHIVVSIPVPETPHANGAASAQTPHWRFTRKQNGGLASVARHTWWVEVPLWRRREAVGPVCASCLLCRGLVPSAKHALWCQSFIGTIIGAAKRGPQGGMAYLDVTKELWSLGCRNVGAAVRLGPAGAEAGMLD